MMKTTEARVARIRITEEALLKILDLEGGAILAVCLANKFRAIEMIMEHPDFPPVQSNEGIPDIGVTFAAHYGPKGSIINVERIDPPKTTK